VVEAAGVEPASEGTSPKDSTCVSASVVSCPACGSGSEPPGTRPGKSRGWTPSHHPATSLLNGIWPPTTRRGQGRRSQLIKLRERTNYPQLTDVPSDLRVNGARHASCESLPPSKPCRPHEERRSNVRKRANEPFHCRASIRCRQMIQPVGVVPLSTLDSGVQPTS
jgi:hypothetical protein